MSKISSKQLCSRSVFDNRMLLLCRSEADSHRAAVAAAQTRLQALEQEAAGAKARQAAAGAQLQELQGQLRQAEAERREAREKYVTLGRRYEGVHAQEAAARMGIQVCSQSFLMSVLKCCRRAVCVSTSSLAEHCVHRHTHRVNPFRHHNSV